MNDFQDEINKRLFSNRKNKALQEAKATFLKESILPKYSYNFSWLGMPIIQYPQDMIAIQEIIWDKRPDLIIETGVARGGSIIMNASLLILIETLSKLKKNNNDFTGSFKSKVIGIDVDIRKENKLNINNHPASKIIELIEGSSTDKNVVSQVKFIAKKYNNIMVILDSNHEHNHVLEELNLYSELVSIGQYCIVFDTVIENLPNDFFPDRPWSVGNNPKTALDEFLIKNNNFEVDKRFNDKLLISAAPDGYLKKIKLT